MRPLSFFRKINAFYVCMIVFCCIGAWLRLHHLGLHNLWNDEAWVALSIKETTISRMIFPDWFTQITPPLFLLIERFVVSLMGTSEYAFRFIPALAGIAIIPLCMVVCRRLFDHPDTALIAGSICTFSPLMVFYAQELKQYSTDALVTVLLLFCAIHIRTRTSLFLMTVTVIICQLLSYTAVFLIPGMLLALFLQTRSRKYSLVVFIQWMIVFILLYMFVIQKETEPWVYDYWKDGYLKLWPPQLFIASFVRQSLDMYFYAFGRVFGLAGIIVILGLSSIGVVHLIRKNNAVAYFVFLPFFLIVGASVFKHYPYGGIRPDFFLVPLLFLLVVSGADATVGWIKKTRMPFVVMLAFVMALIVFPILMSRMPFAKIEQPDERMGVVLSRTTALQRPGDAIAVYELAQYTFAYYATPEQSADILIVGSHAERGTAFLETRHAIELFVADHPKIRMWMYYSLLYPQDVDALAASLSSICSVSDHIREGLSGGILLDCASPATSSNL